MFKVGSKMPALILVVAVLSCLWLPLKAHAVPAAPIIHSLNQADGRNIEARQWGDEFLNGWETTDGYTIILDKNLKSWTYAIRDVEGKLASSSRVVGKDNPPQGNPSMSD